MTLIATGPLTNLAWVLDNFPEACLKIDKVVIMGASPFFLLFALHHSVAVDGLAASFAVHTVVVTLP